MGRVEGKVVLITGGASGFGRQSAIRLAEEGARILVTDINDAGGAKTVELVQGEARYRHLEVVDPGEWDEAIAETLAHFGRLDILVNCAGISPTPDNIEDCTEALWCRNIDVHLTGSFLGCQRAVAAMAPGGGSIINLSSVNGLRAASDFVSYCAAKGAVRMLTKSVAIYCGEQRNGIRCNSIHPGYMRTPMLTDWLDALDDEGATERALVARHPIGRLGDADDIAYMVLYLACDESKFVTGAEMVVDGGYNAA